MMLLLQKMWSTKRGFMIAGAFGIYALNVAMLYLYAPRMGGGDSALSSLSEAELSQRYDSAFWDRKRRVESTVWREALDFCANDDTRARPNCLIVAAVEKAGSGKQLVGSKIHQPAHVESRPSGEKRGEVESSLPEVRAEAERRNLPAPTRRQP